MTEYTYQLYSNLLKMGHSVDLVYSMERSKRNDLFGVAYMNIFFKNKLKKAASTGSYDIVHITNQEAGFAAKVFKQSKGKPKVVTTIHDLMRLEKTGFNKGILQKMYDKRVASYMDEAINYSDFIIFSASTVQKDALQRLRLKQEFATTRLGPKEPFRTLPIPDKPKRDFFNVGYVGAISYRKNVIFILKTALLLKDRNDYKFMIYGSGPDKQSLIEFKEQNGLDNTNFMGFAPEDKLMEIYDSFDLFFYPTLEEGSSLPILDAQARGLPVIIYENTTLDDEVTKYCFKVKDEKEAAQQVINLKENGYEKSLKDEVTAYARSFSWGRVANETYEIYKKLVDR